MSSKITALPLSSGESFLLTTTHNKKEWVVLVDSGKLYGKKSRKLAQVIACVAPDIEKIDIAICTHQDADHANGFKYFADDWYAVGKTIGEYWLPGRWASAVPKVLTAPGDLERDIFHGAVEASRYIERNRPENQSQDTQARPFVSLEEHVRGIASKFVTFGEGEEGCFIDGENRSNQGEEGQNTEGQLANSLGLTVEDINTLRIEDEETDNKNNLKFFETLRRRQLADIYATFTENAAMMQMYDSAMSTAKSIQAIVKSALNWTIPIRWFDFSPFEASGLTRGGIPGFLEPVCSVEFRRPPTKVNNMALLFSLRLSQQNVESLVFQRVESDDEPAVLFLGDSRLSFGIDKPTKNFTMPLKVPDRQIVVTSPHHGSRVNDNAYKVINGWLNVDEAPLYIRNGGQSGQKLGAYLNQSNRMCAQCVQCYGKKWNQQVSIKSNGNVWNWTSNGAQLCGTPKY